MEPLFETTDIRPASATGKRRMTFTTRTMLNSASIILIVAVVAGTLQFWLPPLHAMWQRVFPSPPYSADYVFALAKDGWIMAIQAADGHIAWQTAVTDTPISRYNQLLSVNADAVYAIRSNDQILVALDKRTGKQRWQITAGSATITDAAFDTIYQVNGVFIADEAFRGVNSVVGFRCAGIDALTGKLLWQVDVNDRDHFFANATTVFQIHYVDPTRTDPEPPQSQLLARNPRTGAVLWAHDLPEANRIYAVDFNGTYALMEFETSQATARNGIATSLVLFDVTTQTMRSWQLPPREHQIFLGDAVYTWNWDSPIAQYGLQADSPSLTAFDFATGSQRWQVEGHYYPFDGRGTDLADGKNHFATAKGVMVVGALDGVAGVDLAHGGVRWHFHDLDQDQAVQSLNETAMLVNDSAFVWRSTNQVKAVDPSNGAIRWIMLVPTIDLVQLAHGDQATFVSIDNQLDAVQTTTGKRLWSIRLFTDNGNASIILTQLMVG